MLMMLWAMAIQPHAEVALASGGVCAFQSKPTSLERSPS
jgi:hypothetical protein